MRAPAAMALFKTEGKRRGRARFVAAALQTASVCTPKLGYRTSLTSALRGSPAGLRRARAFSAMAPPVRLGDFAQGPTRRAPCVLPSKKNTRFKPLVRKWYRLVSTEPFPRFAHTSFLIAPRGGASFRVFPTAADEILRSRPAVLDDAMMTGGAHLGTFLIDGAESAPSPAS